MKIALIQPNLDQKYGNQKQAYSSTFRPPETGLAVLCSWIKSYSVKKHEITVLNPNKNIDLIAEQLSGYGLLGITDWFSNHDNCINLARRAKEAEPMIKVVLGGPNASMIPEEILTNHPHIDYIISRDGEEALLSLAEEKPTLQVPNLWFRDINGIVRFTFRAYTDLAKVPLWDYSDFQDWKQRLSEYLKAQKAGLDPWLVPPLTLFGFRGCIKAVKEGACSYCTSSEERARALPAKKLWNQIVHLNQMYGAKIFYMCDDIFTVTPKRIKNIAKAKQKNAEARIRAYAYLPDLAKLKNMQLKAMARNLNKIGVFNLFFGSEHYCSNVLAEMNKQGVGIEETSRIIKVLYDEGGIKTTIAFLLGLPGESKKSLETNFRALERLLQIDNCLERLYISVLAPLKGTVLYKRLESNLELSAEYLRNTGKALQADDSPDYELLARLSIKYMTSTTPKEINHYLGKMIQLAGTKMPDYRIGGFLLDIND